MNMKKLASLLLALLMVMSVATAMAEISDKKISPENFLYIRSRAADGSITVENPVASQTYTAYKIFDVMYDKTEKNYAYTIESDGEWFAVVAEYAKKPDSGLTLTQVGTLNTWVVEHTNAFSAADFAAYLKTQLDDEKTGKLLVEGENGQISVDQLPHGYYFVTSTMGALCSLTTTDPDAMIREKNEKPAVTKEVQEDSTGEWGETNDADIGQVVNFRATVTVQEGTENYILHDTMSTGLTFNGIDQVKVFIGDQEITADGNFEVRVGTETENPCTFEVVFKNEFIAKQDAGTDIVITYSATVNSGAVVGKDGNPNEVKLQYGDVNNPAYTPVDTTITYTWDMDVLKYADGDETKVLKGAKFILLNAAKTHVAKIVDGKFVEWVEIKAETKLSDYELTTDENGKIEIDGLDADTYHLRETAAPNGYNLLTKDVTVVIIGAESDGTTLTYTTVVAKIENKAGSQLPETGGTGTTMLYIVGGALMLAAFVLIVSKRRATEN